jgi:hypothetical protein
MGRIQNILHQLDLLQYSWRAKVASKKEIQDPRRKKILNSFELSDEQKKKIDDFYIENYGKKIPYEYHRYYSSYMSSFDEKYIPEFLFISEIEAKLNPLNYSSVLSDKNLLPLLVGNNSKYKCAEIYVSSTNTVLRNGEYILISKSKAYDILKNIGPCFYKPTIDSCSGHNCDIYDFENGVDKKTKIKLEDILDKSPKNFNFQQIVKNCESVRKLHPESLNTFRIVTYILENQVYHFPVIMRIGRGNAILDNAHQGGIFIGVEDDGQLKNCGFTEFQERFYEHPDSKIKFDGYQVPEIKQCIDAAHEMQSKLPQTKLISFDFIADETGTPVLIEMNLNYQTIWLSQMAHGKGAFGDNSSKILKMISGKA